MITDKEMKKLALRFREWQRLTNGVKDLWLGEDYVFDPQSYSAAMEKRAQDALLFCEHAPELILRLMKEKTDAQ